MKKSLYEIKSEAAILLQKTDDELLLKVQNIKKRSKKESLDNLLIEWFALVQEISFRKIGLRHFESQLLAGMILHQGKIVEMKTGEGKTLASTLAISLNALSSQGVHVVTVNDYLAERDKNWMGKIYQGLELSVGLIKSSDDLAEKRKNYSYEISYLTNSELVFDYLRDSSSFYKDEIVQRPFNYCIIDEIDSILIDEARTPLILSSSQGKNNLKKLYVAKEISNRLEKDLHFEVDEKRREINLTEKGYQNVKEQLGKETLYDLDDPWILEILNALKAKYVFKLNKDYIVLNNKILIVDEFTGRVMEDRRWSMGIHEAIETKENVEVGEVTKTKSSITYQNFFTLYPKLAGMTGTAKTAEKEFKDIYNLDVVVLPTSKPTIRKDLPDFVYQTELSKWKAVLQKSKECFQKGQPILIGTASVEKSEFLSDLFKISNIPHQVLNAKPENITRESEIVAQAGQPYAVTIATNMAGRGTDIILGGNPSFQVKQILNDIFLKIRSVEEIWEDLKLLFDFSKNTKLENKMSLPVLKQFIQEIYKEQKNKRKILEIKDEVYPNQSDKILKELETDIANLPYSLDKASESFKTFYNTLYEIIYLNWTKKNSLVKELGGLFVLGTERHETRRIDNQLRGRSGRQGDPGFSQFFVSLDDDLIKIFGGDSIRRWLNYLMNDKDAPLESSFLTQSLEKAQKKVELYNYEIRKNVFQYDEIINLQRKQLFQIRQQILSTNIYNELALRYAEFQLDEELFQFFQKKSTKQTNEEKNHFFYKLEKQFGAYSTLLIKDLKLKEVFTQNQFQNEAFSSFKNFKSEKKDFQLQFYPEIWISTDLRLAQSNFYQLGFFQNTQNTTLLSIIDFYWTEHIERMNYIRDTINWRAYGQQNPLIEYNTEAFNSYKLMLEQIRSSMLYYLLENPILK
jgi:preprotein translocase subunit SecA